MPEFNISIAYAPAACNQFRVKVTRTDPSICSLARDGRVSASPAEQEYITKIVGPDTFSIRVEGAERFAMSTPTRYSREECSYEYDVRLNTPGTVWLIGFRMFQVGLFFRSVKSGTLTSSPRTRAELRWIL